MAKKFVRGITDVKTINNQDFDTNNVNDLLSDGQYNYIHRKKGVNEEYHNLTDNIKTISSDNTELLSVTNNNKTTNTATLHPKHDAQKEQLLESTRDTITINHGTNGTAEKTTVDTNPQKVLEHENLISDSEYITLDHQTDENTTHIQAVKLKEKLDDLQQNKQDKLTAGDGLSIDSNNITINPKRIEDLPGKNGFYYGDVTKEGAASYAAISLNTDNNKYVQLAFRQAVNTPGLIIAKYRFVVNNVATRWNEMLLDDGTIRAMVEKKQDKLIAGEGITIQGQTISATGATSTIEYDHTDGTYQLFKYVVTNGYYTFVTYTFNVNSGTPQLTFTVGDIKNDLEKFVRVDSPVSNGAITITNDGTTIKVTNSKSTESGSQQGTFTFYSQTSSGGGGGTV